MKAVKYLEEKEVIRRGIDALYEKLGPVEARRFLSIRRSPPREDSVERHRKWQDSLDRDEFFARAMAAHRAQAKKP